VIEDVRVYLIDRAGSQANVFAARVTGQPSLDLVGVAANVDDALDEITVARPDVILVGTDVGGAGVVEAVERILTIAGDVAVVALCTGADKALVDAAVHLGAAGSLDRAASDIDTLTALHVYRDRQHGADVDIRLAEPSPEKRSIRVSGALPLFPEPEPPVSYADQPPPQSAMRPESEPEPEPEPEPESEAESEPESESTPTETVHDELQEMREMLRGEAAAAAGKAPKRKIGRLFGRGRDKKQEEKPSAWGPKEGDEEARKPV
jgi:chemotaxis response regulator CheB